MKKNLYLLTAGLLLGGISLFAQSSPKSNLAKSSTDTTKRTNVRGATEGTRLQESNNPNAEKISSPKEMKMNNDGRNQVAEPAKGAAKQRKLEQQP